MLIEKYHIILAMYSSALLCKYILWLDIDSKNMTLASLHVKIYDGLPSLHTTKQNGESVTKVIHVIVTSRSCRPPECKPVSGVWG